LAKIEHHKIIAHDHHANGYVEHNNRTVRETLKKMVLACKDKSPKDWNLLVPAVAFALNSRMHSTFNATPFALMFGWGPFSLPFKNDVDQRTVQKLQQDRINMMEFWKIFNTCVPTAVRDARELKLFTQWYPHSTGKFEVGDIVMWQDPI
jgi:hypothetical protein